jgi:hypothetical protein
MVIAGAVRPSRSPIGRGRRHQVNSPVSEKEHQTVKTMTCKQLGGPCDLPLEGGTADEIIKLQDKHLKDVVAAGDEAHRSALAAMKGRWKRPVSGMKWYRATKREFAALPEG